jgi:hypothetical protein
MNDRWRHEQVNRYAVLLLIPYVGLFLRGGLDFHSAPVFALPVVDAAESWEAEFHDVCGRTDDAMIMGIDELKSLTRRCDAMKAQIEKLPEPGRKVFLKRLRMCRDLYIFTIETKENK